MTTRHLLHIYLYHFALGNSHKKKKKKKNKWKRIKEDGLIFFGLTCPTGSSARDVHLLRLHFFLSSFFHLAKNPYKNKENESIAKDYFIIILLLLHLLILIFIAVTTLECNGIYLYCCLISNSKISTNNNRQFFIILAN